MTISANTVWECRTTGSDTNGGGFVAGASGTDFSQQDTAQIAVTDAVANGTTTITSATANFGATHVGNIIYLADGSGSLAATSRQVASITNSTTIVVDATVAAGTGITLNLGGAKATPAGIAAMMVTSNRAWIKSGTYTTTAGFTFNTGMAIVTNSVMPNRLTGYYQTRGDIKQTTLSTYTNNANRPILKLSTNSNLTCLSLPNGGWMVENLSIDCSSLATSIGIKTGTNQGWIRNCKIIGATTYPVQFSGGGLFEDNEITANTCTHALVLDSGQATNCSRNNIHDNTVTGYGIWGGSGGSILRNIVANNAGGPGIRLGTGNNFVIEFNTIYGNGGDGIVINIRLWGSSIRNNILASNTGYGLENGDGAGTPALPEFDGNAYWNNSLGTRHNMDDTGTTNPVNSSAPYTNVFDVILTANPFTNAAGGDFTLNNTAGGGAVCRGAGTPGAFPGSSVIGYVDIGAIQHADPAAGGGANLLGSGTLVL